MSTVRYWAGAKAAAGVAEEAVEASSVGAAIALAVERHPALSQVVPLCALLIDGRRVDAATELPAQAVLEILPPFAGG
ncbi:MoaD/ThiS family protein [Calidifontibacter terrae]